jgi:hypothetical protein
VAKERAHIMVISNTGVPLGYIRSVSWTTHKFFMTESKMQAKGYASGRTIQTEIARLKATFGSQGFDFIYD